VYELFMKPMSSLEYSVILEYSIVLDVSFDVSMAKAITGIVNPRSLPTIELQTVEDMLEVLYPEGQS
jgi:hypothetical protein